MRNIDKEQKKAVLARLEQLKIRLEKDVERKLVRGIRNQGGMCRKFVSPGWAGAPDRIVLLPGGRMYFIEMKRPGEEPEPLQQHRIEELQALGFNARAINTEEDVNIFLKEVRL
jgi:Holliday junction resolvase